eukprot:5348760-Prorocentrum_lima.AAC.1
MTSSLVGSEMCIRDRLLLQVASARNPSPEQVEEVAANVTNLWVIGMLCDCLLYTSDAADDM